MANQYVNKVVQSNGTTIIDITDTTAIASDVASGKYFYTADGQKTEGTSSGSGDSDFTFSADTVKTVQFVKGSSSEIYVDFTKFSNLSSLYMEFSGTNAATNWTKISIKPPTSRKDIRGMFTCSTAAGNTSLTQIEIDGTLLCTGTNTGGLFGNRRGLKTITGAVDFAGLTRADFYSGTNVNNAFYQCIALETVSLVAGTMAMTTTNWNLSWCSKLSDDSLVSIANCLKDTYSGTITFHATPKAKLSAIMGTVGTSDGLSIFTKDSSGTVSLQSFITTTKGASLA